MGNERDRGQRRAAEPGPGPYPGPAAGPVVEPDPVAEPGPDLPSPHPYPVPDAAAYLAGRWDVERTVHDLRTGTEGHFHGTAKFRPDGAAGSLLHHEEGQLTDRKSVV